MNTKKYILLIFLVFGSVYSTPLSASGTICLSPKSNLAHDSAKAIYLEMIQHGYMTLEDILLLINEKGEHHLSMLDAIIDNYIPVSSFKEEIQVLKTKNMKKDSFEASLFQLKTKVIQFLNYYIEYKNTKSGINNSSVLKQYDAINRNMMHYLSHTKALHELFQLYNGDYEKYGRFASFTGVCNELNNYRDAFLFIKDNAMTEKNIKNTDFCGFIVNFFQTKLINFGISIYKKELALMEQNPEWRTDEEKKAYIKNLSELYHLDKQLNLKLPNSLVINPILEATGVVDRFLAEELKFNKPDKDQYNYEKENLKIKANFNNTDSEIYDLINIHQTDWADILNNLLNNAIESFNEIKDNNVNQIIIDFSKDKSKLYIKISENGSGITSDLLKKLNSKQIHEAQTTKKTGVGMGTQYIKEIIFNACGTIQYKSIRLSESFFDFFSKRHQTTVTVEIPYIDLKDSIDSLLNNSSVKKSA